MMAFPALRVRHIPVKPPGNENVGRQRIMLPLHLLDGCIRLLDCLGEGREGSLQAVGTHAVHLNVISAIRQGMPGSK
jgi:hypothetical protein